jgi:hypothetical protein
LPGEKFGTQPGKPTPEIFLMGNVFNDPVNLAPHVVGLAALESVNETVGLGRGPPIHQNNEQWPLALRVEAFRPEREKLKQVVSVALAEDEKGTIEPKTIETVQSAIDQLRFKFEKLAPSPSPTTSRPSRRSKRWLA